MEKVRRFFRNFNEKRSYQIVFFIVSMCVILGGYFVLRMKVTEEVSHRYTVVEDKNVIKYIEDVSIEEDTLTVSGWCFYKDFNSNQNDVQIFLRNIDDEKDIVWLEVEMVQRDDINAYFDSEYDYSQVGFYAKTKTKRLNLQEKNYEIFVKLNCKNDIKNVWTTSTHRYICSGIFTSFKPEEKQPQKTKSDIFNAIIDNGQLLMYNKSVDLYLYQYEKSLYWVAGEEYCFEKDGTTTIPYQLRTTRIDKLPAYRLENGWDWDSKGFVFEEKEIVLGQDVPYRVAMSDIPLTYPVIYFWTGNYEEGVWNWLNTMNLDIRELQK